MARAARTAASRVLRVEDLRVLLEQVARVHKLVELGEAATWTLPVVHSARLALAPCPLSGLIMADAAVDSDPAMSLALPGCWACSELLSATDGGDASSRATGSDRSRRVPDAYRASLGQRPGRSLIAIGPI